MWLHKKVDPNKPVRCNATYKRVSFYFSMYIKENSLIATVRKRNESMNYHQPFKQDHAYCSSNSKG